MHLDILTIERRLAALEIENTRLRNRMRYVSSLALLPFILAAAPASKKIVADEIVARTIIVRTSDDGPTVGITADDKLAVINVGASDRSHVGIVASAETSGIRVVGLRGSEISVAEIRGAGSVLIADASGEPRAGISVDSEGAKIRLHDAQKRPAVQLAVEDRTGYRALEVYTSKQKRGASVSVLNDSGVVTVEDHIGYRAELGTSLLQNQSGDITATSAASLKMFDNSNTLIWSAPQH